MKYQVFCYSLCYSLGLAILTSLFGQSLAQSPLEPEPTAPLNLSPETIDQSPVLQRWLESVPKVRSDIRNAPSFTTRNQAGYTFFPSSYGAELHYYVLPLGSYFNVSPIVGYRHAESGDDYSIDGAHVGVRARFVPSRTGAADITLDQSWIVGDSESLNITQLNLGYAVTSNLRLSTDLEWQRTASEGDGRVGINLEWSL